MANAGCINAYDCAGCYLTTLQQLQSDNIGVAINYTAPSEYGRRQLDYIKYTDKCGCTCCLTGENELRIYATQGVIKNLTLTNDDTNEVVNVKWTDLFGSNWKKTVVRYKTGSYPSSVTDGTLAVEETTQNQYATNGYNVSGLTDGTTYYFSVFAVAQDDTIIVVQSKSVTTDFRFPVPTNTYAFYELTSNGNDSSGHNRNLSVASGITFSTTNGAYLPNTSHSGMVEPFGITSKGNWTIIRRQKTIGAHSSGSDERGIDIYWNSSTRICTLWSGSKQSLYMWTDTRQGWTESTNTWYNHILTIENGVGKLYIDNVLVYTGTTSTSATSSYFRRGQEYNNAYPRQLYGYLKQIIIENKVYTEAERNRYYNKIKTQYGKS